MVLEKLVKEPLQFDCVHHALYPHNLSEDQPRDVIDPLHYLEDKNAVMLKLRGTPVIDFDAINIFLDFSKEALEPCQDLKLFGLRSWTCYNPMEPPTVGGSSCLIAFPRGSSSLVP